MPSEWKNCPSCGADMQDKPIPEAHRESYGGATHFTRVIGVEYAFGHHGRYDGVSEWRCPDCGYREGRWSGRELVGDDYERPFDLTDNVNRGTLDP